MSSVAGTTVERNQIPSRTAGGLSGGQLDAGSAIDTPTPKVTAVQSRPGYGLSITYADGREIVADFSDVIRRGGEFRPLRDERLFSRVRTSPLGDSIEWPVPRGEALLSIDAASIYRTFDAIAARHFRKRMA